MFSGNQRFLLEKGRTLGLFRLGRGDVMCTTSWMNIEENNRNICFFCYGQYTNTNNFPVKLVRIFRADERRHGVQN